MSIGDIVEPVVNRTDQARLYRVVGRTDHAIQLQPIPITDVEPFWHSRLGMKPAALQLKLDDKIESN